MAPAKDGDTVKVHYTGRLTDGTVFDSSENRDPLEFTVGAGQVIPGVEHAVAGMEPGESKETTIPAAEAYGPYRADIVTDVERSRFPDHIEPEVGQRLQVDSGGKRLVVTVTEVTDASVKLDANHQLAGKDLVFELELVDVS